MKILLIDHPLSSSLLEVVSLINSNNQINHTYTIENENPNILAISRLSHQQGISRNTGLEERNMNINMPFNSTSNSFNSPVIHQKSNSPISLSKSIIADKLTLKDLREKNTLLTNSNNTLKNALSKYTSVLGINEKKPEGHMTWLYIQRLTQLDVDVPFPADQSRFHLLHNLWKALSIGHLTVNKISYDIILAEVLWLFIVLYFKFGSFNLVTGTFL